MNNGYFFRLNKNLSRIDDGIAIYDYIDLPAYFESSKSNLMSPKFPINVTILHDSVSFRLHYSAFRKSNEKNAQTANDDAQNKSRDENDNDYYYDSEHFDDNIKVDMAHLEEVLFELPFSAHPEKPLHKILKEIYNAPFPQPMNEDLGGGGRFLKKIINKRYPENGVRESGSDTALKENESKQLVSEQLYKSKRKFSNSILSYSSLELMGFDKRQNQFNIYNEQGIIVGFLRKLTLDFMFDMIHSDVFKNSCEYSKMYSGLMSDYYFSALVHKCEYYYNRHRIYNLYKEESSDGNSNIERIKKLYLEQLVESEKNWIDDIISPLSEQHFEYLEPAEHKKRFELKNIPSWFANPEEEMRRVHLVLRKYNSEGITRTLELRKEKDDPSSLRLMNMSRHMRYDSSKWFLKRYDFHDLFALHLFPIANYVITAAIALVMGLLTFSQSSTTYLLLGALGALVLIMTASVLWRSYNHELLHRFRPLKLFRIPLHLMLPRLVASIATAWFTLTLGFDLFNSFFDSKPSWLTIVFICIIIFFFVLFKINQITPNLKGFNKVLRGIELMMISFMISFSIGIVMVNFLGQNYIERGGTISDFYSQYVYTNDDIKENSLKTFESKIKNGRFFIYDNGKANCSETLDSLKDGSLVSFKRLQNELTNVFHTDKNGTKISNRPLAKVTPVLNIGIFELRNFTITFSFVAMFIGIFIQLIIFGDNKQMTEL